MPKLTVDGIGVFDIPQGKRLIAALREEAGTDQLHACGGKARCTTCRVEFLAGEPEQITAAEKAILEARGVSGVRLSCQIACDHDMTVRLSLHTRNRTSACGMGFQVIDNHPRVLWRFWVWRGCWSRNKKFHLG